MLVIKRREGQAIRIADGIEVQITEISPTRVTLGILAPRDVPVTRSEVALTREQNLEAAAQSLTTEALARFARAVNG